MQCIVCIAIVKLDMSVKAVNRDCDVVEVKQNMSNLAEDIVKRVGGYDVFVQLIKVKWIGWDFLTDKILMSTVVVRYEIADVEVFEVDDTCCWWC